MDKETIKAVMEAAKDAGLQEVRHGDPRDKECGSPWFVIYVVKTHCVTINNGACKHWWFCKHPDNDEDHSMPNLKD